MKVERLQTVIKTHESTTIWQWHGKKNAQPRKDQKNVHRAKHGKLKTNISNKRNENFNSIIYLRNVLTSFIMY